MITIQSQPQKEVMAVDADDHLRRPFLSCFHFSEMRLSKAQVRCEFTRITPFSRGMSK
jgi:hypothetical protein